ncbi:hypothetical protein [Leptolyngbya sp. FACHB-17]|uniref:hypothetical protein n=1 Tax=unclassified Leptolyngbya TaxID=2650499 RepID=UPI001680376E|nr:hypothetical protein [Leptolyngbya sp. FACHB-17]MBD2083372.1 hypothetical protein [Leptolyngbya sp. FACHB-17]
MITRNFVDQLAETLAFGGIGIGAVLALVTNTIKPNPQIATFSTLTACTLAIGYREVTRKRGDQKVYAERDALKVSLHQMELSLRNAELSLEQGLKQRQEYYEAKLSEMRSKLNSDANLQTKFDEVRKAFDQRATELKNALAECDRLRSEAASFEGQKQQWVQKFDQLISEQNQEYDKLHSQIAQLERENLQYKARFDSADEIAKLRADKEASELKDSIAQLQKTYDQKMGEFKQLATLYNSLRTEDDSKFAELQSKFAYLTGQGFQEVEQEFNSELSTRDRMLLAASAKISELEKPHLFDDIGDFVRPNRLIKSLWESEERICLDASEIVPHGDNSGFDVYFSLRDRRARGQATIDALNERGNEFSVLCGTIKDLKFEYDRVNPHRIKASFVLRKPEKIAPKTTIDKLWIPSEQFASKTAKLLKKPMTRVMGSTGEGKGIFVNLLLAVEANQSTPSAVRLHDPMDGSSADYWQVPKTSKGKNATRKAVQIFAKEFNDRLENQISAPLTLDVFDEIDIVASDDPSINKAFLNTAKGMRHCGMRAVIIGQSPSVGKKGFEWADLDNFNAVYFGTAIVTAIDKTPALEMQSAKLKETYQKLSDYCDKQNEEHGLDPLTAWNAYRFGLVVTQGKATFFELPNADSIACDWTRLNQASEVSKDVLKSSDSDSSTCSHSSYNVRKTFKDSNGVPVKQYRKCKNCGENFTVNL